MSSFAPVLVTGFNRPKLLEEQLESVLEMGCKIYLSLDVPKKGDFTNAESSQKCVAIADRYLNDLASVRVSTENLGAFRGITEAISWGFKQEKALIILEDDVRVNNVFLSYATEMLEKFEENTGVGSIAGTNFVPESNLTKKDDSIRFSAFTSSWGWATWSDRWGDYLQDLDIFPIQDFRFPYNFWNWRSRRYWLKVFGDTANGKYDAWDYRWLYSNWKRRRLTVVPNANLVLNVGFGEGATHTKDVNLPWWLPREIETSFQLLTIPSSNIRDEKADCWMEENHYRVKILQQLRSEFSSRFPKTSSLYRWVVVRA